MRFHWFGLALFVILGLRAGFVMAMEKKCYPADAPVGAFYYGSVSMFVAYSFDIGKAIYLSETIYAAPLCFVTLWVLAYFGEWIYQLRHRAEKTA